MKKLFALLLLSSCVSSNRVSESSVNMGSWDPQLRQQLIAGCNGGMVNKIEDPYVRNGVCTCVVEKMMGMYPIDICISSRKRFSICMDSAALFFDSCFAKALPKEQVDAN